MSLRAAIAVLMMTACHPTHEADTADNTATAAAYQVALEACIAHVKSDLEAGVDHNKIAADYKACADAADKKYGRTGK